MQPGALVELVDRLGEPRILVVGDLMLDQYVWGDAERISQEAPVPMLRVDVDKTEYRLGGAGSVCANLAALGARVACVGIVGSDTHGTRLRRELEKVGAEVLALPEVDDGRPTTVKQRFIGQAQHRHAQQMLRADYECTEPIPPGVVEQLLSAVRSALAEFDAVLLSDYDKGVCTPAFVGELNRLAREHGRRVIVDPIRGTDYSRYRGASCITPNRLEAQLATGMTLQTPEDAKKIGRRICRDLSLEAALITLDRDGICLCTADGREKVFPTRPRQVYDITGAGDMVLSMIGMTVAAGGTYAEAAQLANVAGGLEVEKIGVATVTREEIRRDLLIAHHATLGKVRRCDDLVAELHERRRNGDTVAFTNGCFDLLHAGHVRYLQAARAEADCLVVGVNTNRSVRDNKGPGRPINSEDHRAEVLAALEAVDYVVLFDEPTPLELIRRVRPDVLIKGADWAEKGVVGREFVEENGGCVVLVDVVPGLSTSALIDRVRHEGDEATDA